MSTLFLPLIMFLGMILLLLTGRQIFIIIGSVAAIVALFLWGEGATFMPFSKGTTFIDFYSLLAIPPFIFMGSILSKSGVAERIYQAIYVWSGRIRGSLAIGTVIMCAIIAAMSGTNIAGTVTGTTVALPEMLKRNYDKKLAVGTIMSGGSLGFLIPPSVVFIFYGVIARTSIAYLWLAGIGPGILLTILYIIYILIVCKKKPELAEVMSLEEYQKITLKDKCFAALGAIPALLLILLVLGTLFMGIITLVESSAIGAIGAIICAAINKKLNWNIIEESMEDCLHTTTMVMWILTAAFFFSSVFDAVGAVKGVESLLNLAGGNKWITLIIMQISFIFLGMVLDDTAMLIIVAPVYIPIALKLGFDIRWFGVLYVINCQMAFITPPFGYNLFLMKGIAPEGITTEVIYKSVPPFVLIQLIALILVMIFPQIAMYLPSLRFGV
ncbi:MAG: TRAP transporter large permease subunit [Atribacterota bacterium]|nr:TRAP transporter large permease subunit [Atribacterota bacterium]